MHCYNFLSHFDSKLCLVYKTSLDNIHQRLKTKFSYTKKSFFKWIIHTIQ